MDLKELARLHQSDYLDTVRKLVEIETPSYDKSANDHLADFLENLLQEDGWQVERVKQEQCGDQLIARKPTDSAGGTLLLCHMDTVWPVGTLVNMPLNENGGKLFGPGTLDMKAGIATAIHALRLIEEYKLTLKEPVTLLVTTDEETGSNASRELIEKLTLNHRRVFVLEPGCEDGSLKIARKCVGSYRALFRGIAAHAGNNPQEGASALREFAHFLLFTEVFTDYSKGTTVNCTVAQGGMASNTISAEASAKINMRARNIEEGHRVEKALYEYEPHDKRVSVEISGGITRPPLEFTPANQALFNEVKKAMKTVGVHLEGASVGGGSDGSFASAAGVATIDGLGSVGAGPHSEHEHIRIEETIERLALLIALLTS